jgi:hypothetical protein
MFPVGSFDRMMHELNWRESNKGTDMPITVAILIADFRRQYARENIFTFSSKLYDEFIKKLENNRIKVQLQTEIIIIEYKKERLGFSHCLHCNLEACQSEGKIESAKQFLDALIEISKKQLSIKNLGFKLKQIALLDL